MPTNLLDQAVQRRPRRFQQRSSDVFALVKAYVSDSYLSQPGLLVLPGDTIADHVEPQMNKLARGDAPLTSAFLGLLIPVNCKRIQCLVLPTNIYPYFPLPLCPSTAKDLRTTWKKHAKQICWSLLMFL